MTMQIVPQTYWFEGGEITFESDHMQVRKSVKHDSLYFVDITPHDHTVGATEDKDEAIKIAKKLQDWIDGVGGVVGSIYQISN